jgi:predicted Zn-dependent protease
MNRGSSSIENEAQFAFVMGHEMGHVGAAQRRASKPGDAREREVGIGAASR